jgi:hypothetical protein
MRKTQCTTIYVCDSNKEKRSKLLRSILGVLPCSILRIWRLWARAKNEYTMDDFSMLTIREPWLLKRISMSMASAWLAEKELILQGRRDWRRDAKSIGLSKRALWGKGRLIKEFPNLLYARWLQVGTSRNILRTPLLISQILGFDNSLFWKCNTFQSWRDAYACAVWCSWCTLEWLGYPYALVIGNAINSRERICVTSCFLTTKIPSALLVAVVWLQHTRYPRFRRGTFGYVITSSPIKRGRVVVRSFHADAR